MVYVIVGIAAMIGACLRYIVGLAVHDVWNSTFPFATLFINILGCFSLSFFTTYLFKLPLIPTSLKTGIGTGIIGSFTTFSTLSVETVQLLQASHWVSAVIYVLLSLWGGLTTAYVGFHLGNKLYIKRKKGGEHI